MRRSTACSSAAALAAVLVLAGCGSSGQSGRVLGFEKEAPDEFRVVERAPLSLPPDYGLRPPTPGAERPQEQSRREQASDILLSRDQTKQGERIERDRRRTASLANKSAGEVALLRQTGALDVDPGIRQVVNREAAGAVLSEDDGFLDKLMFWKSRDEPGRRVPQDTTIVDPAQEQRRLRENAALGRPATDGPTPVIRRKASGGLF